MPLRVVLATHNQHKAAEFQGILGARIPDLVIEPYEGPEPVEDGITFAENALIKARAAVAFTRLPAIADDSGICVDVLGGSPGIFSARWSGVHGDAAANNRLLLDQLAAVPDAHRGAHFRATMALVLPSGEEHIVDGIWPGRLLRTPRGANGHGYDPVFLPDGCAESAAELAPEDKNTLSHRARAFAALEPLLRDLVRA